MKAIYYITTFFLLFFYSASHSQIKNTCVSLIKKDSSNQKEKNNTLLAFVGEKIYLKVLHSQKYSFDSKYKAKYRILQNVYGNYQAKTIEFIIYSHHGLPAFSKNKNVLLFVSKFEGKFYHEKYIYNVVYKTKDGRWAGSYDAGDYGHSNNKNTTVKPEKIDFTEEASIDIKGKSERELSIWYPEPFYKINGSKAIAIYGNYIPELFRLQKEGVLKARELF
jgi:hypothetical protein